MRGQIYSIVYLENRMTKVPLILVHIAALRLRCPRQSAPGLPRFGCAFGACRSCVVLDRVLAGRVY
jgi:hypothetical protein